MRRRSCCNRGLWYGTTGVLLNPQIPSGETAKRVLDELLIAHKKYLPRFKKKIEELEKEGVTIKDDVARELTEQGL